MCSQVTNIPLENAYETNLAGSISATATECTVDTAPQFTLPAGQTVDAVIDPENSSRERVTITGISGGTFTITRGQPDYLGDTGTAYAHGGGATFVITDSWSVFNDMATAINSKIDTVDGQLAVYADAAARDAAIPSPANGMQCYLTDRGKSYDYLAGSWVARESGGTFSNASETVAGKAEEATAAETAAGTATGGTGAELFVAPDKLQSSDVSKATSAGAGDAGKLVKYDGAGKVDAGNVELATTPALEDDSGLQVKLKTGGGITKSADGLETTTTATYTQDYTYGESIVAGNVLYHKQSDNKVYKVTSNKVIHDKIIGVADEDGSANDTDKRIQTGGLISGASFSAINPTYNQTSTGGSQNVGENGGTVYYAVAAPLDNSDGPECKLSGDITVNIGHTGPPANNLEIKIVRGTSSAPYFGRSSSAEEAFGDSIFSTTVSAGDVSSSASDYTFTLTEITVPANSTVWLLFYAEIEGAGGQYWTITTDTSTDGWRLYDSGSGATGAPYFTFPSNGSSVNPWDERYAVRAYGDGTTGGYGIGTSSNCDGAEKPIGHVVSSTEWMLDLRSRQTVQDSSSLSFQAAGTWTDRTNSFGFRPYILEGYGTSGPFLIGGEETGNGNLDGEIKPLFYEDGVVWTYADSGTSLATVSSSDTVRYKAST